MATTSLPVQCANRDCKAAETGKCVEGNTLTECSHYGRPRLQAPETARTIGLALPGADRLKDVDANKVMRASESRVVAIVAPTGSGKTSLIAAAYELFQRGPAESLAFAGSSTLHAFESACHDSRAASQRAEPDMKRTPISGVSFYHLQLATLDTSSQRALLLADRAGEDYRSVVDDPGAVRILTEVARAECLTLLIDGKRLLDNEDRHNLRGELEVMIKALVDMKATRSEQHLAVVLTKLDELADSPHEARAKRDFDQLVRQVRIHHAAAFGSIREFQVAASPKKSTLARGTGVADLLTWWMNVEMAQPAVEIQMPVAARAFGRLEAR